jgi:L-seryl-tRNA(Ser) seleniumtransferase
MRVDKLTLSALEATLRLYLDPERALREIPVLAMLTVPVGELQSRAGAIAATLAAIGIAAEVVASSASVGGGAFPTAAIPSIAIRLPGPAQRVEEKLRAGAPAVISRISDGHVFLDVRSVLPREDQMLAAAIGHALS